MMASSYVDPYLGSDTGPLSAALTTLMSDTEMGRTAFMDRWQRLLAGGWIRTVGKGSGRKWITLSPIREVPSDDTEKCRETTPRSVARRHITGTETGTETEAGRAKPLRRRPHPRGRSGTDHVQSPSGGRTGELRTARPTPATGRPASAGASPAAVATVPSPAKGKRDRQERGARVAGLHETDAYRASLRTREPDAPSDVVDQPAAETSDRVEPAATAVRYLPSDLKPEDYRRTVRMACWNCGEPADVYPGACKADPGGRMVYACGCRAARGSTARGAKPCSGCGARTKHSSGTCYACRAPDAELLAVQALAERQDRGER